MKRLREVERVSPDEATLRAWEEMRIEILHQIQEGASVPDELVDVAGDLAVTLRAWSPAQPPSIPKSRFHVN